MRIDRRAVPISRRDACALLGGALLGGASGDAQAENGRMRGQPGRDVTLDLARAISHATLEAPRGATIVPGWARAGLATPQGAHVYRVTTLADDMRPGALRHAVTEGSANHNPGDPSDGSTASGPRLVVFDVSGVIVLGDTLGIERPRTYVAGQTAPGHLIFRGASITIRASDVVLRHVSVIPGLPASVDAARRSTGIGVVRWSGPDDPPAIVERVWVDQYLIAAWPDQAPVTYTNYRNEIHDVAFTNGVAIEPYKAPALEGAWATFEKASHNYGMLVGDRTLGCVFAGNIIAGCSVRTPQVKMATASVIFGNYIHDFAARGFDMQPAPIQVLTTDDVGDVSQFPIGRHTHLSVSGNYAEPGEQTRAGGRSISGAMVERIFNAEAGQLVRCFHGFNLIDPSVAGAVWNRDGSALGADGRAAAYTSVGDGATSGHVVLDEPQWWSDHAPTHPAATRAWTLDHAGPRPAEPHALMARTLRRLAAQGARDWLAGERQKLYRDTPTEPDDDFLAPVRSPAPWSPPGEGFSTAPNGLTHVENALNALSVALGGAPWGNVDRPLTTRHDGRLTVERAGLLRWRPSGAAHPPLTLTVAFADGGEAAIRLESD